MSDAGGSDTTSELDSDIATLEVNVIHTYNMSLRAMQRSVLLSNMILDHITKEMEAAIRYLATNGARNVPSVTNDEKWRADMVAHARASVADLYATKAVYASKPIDTSSLDGLFHEAVNDLYCTYCQIAADTLTDKLSFMAELGGIYTNLLHQRHVAAESSFQFIHY